MFKKEIKMALAQADMFSLNNNTINHKKKMKITEDAMLASFQVGNYVFKKLKHVL